MQNRQSLMATAGSTCPVLSDQSSGVSWGVNGTSWEMCQALAGSILVFTWLGGGTMGGRLVIGIVLEEQSVRIRKP
jgi:hypothetical protein